MKKFWGAAMMLLICMTIPVKAVDSASVYYKGFKMRTCWRISVEIGIEWSDEAVGAGATVGPITYRCCDDASQTLACQFSIEDSWCATNVTRSPHGSADVVIFD